jgi:class 3 adenylate cyclase
MKSTRKKKKKKKFHAKPPMGRDQTTGPMTPNPAEAINAPAEELEAINKSIGEMVMQKGLIVKRIRNSSQDAVVVFVDLVGSTKNKINHKDEPEIWIFGIRQFYSVLTNYVRQLGGRIVKYIGDEVMAVFDGDASANNSVGLISRIKEIEGNLSKATGQPTAVKIAVDYGPVYTIGLQGHAELDVLGTTVDRCARIAKFAEAGVVLASADYVKMHSFHIWEMVGEPELKGIGKTKIYQLGQKTVSIVPESPKVDAAVLAKVKLGRVSRSPETLKPGQALNLRYEITAPVEVPEGIWLGAHLRANNGPRITSRTEDKPVALRAGKNTYSRSLTIPLKLPGGVYTANLGLWFGTPDIENSSIQIDVRRNAENVTVTSPG